MPESKKRKKARGSKRGPRSMRRPDPKESVQAVVRMARELVELEEPLEAETWISGLLGTMFDRPEREAMDAFLEAILNHCERSRTRESLALLAGLAAVAPPPVAEHASAGAERLRSQGVADVAWGPLVGNADFVGAWLLTHPLGDQDGVLLSFRHPGRAAHAFNVVVDHNLGGMAKDAVCTGDAQKVLSLWSREDPDAAAHPIDAAEAAGRLREALAATDQTVEPPVSFDFVQLRALLEARIRELPVGWEPEPFPEMSEPERDALVEVFLSSAEAAGLGPDDEDAPARVVAEAIVAYRCGYADGDPLRWSSIVAELFMLDWVPRKTNLPDEALELLPDAVRAWVRYAGRRKGLAQRHVDETLAAVDRFEKEFTEAVHDPSRFGPAKQLVSAMLADGVELTDQAQVDEWIRAFNERPFQERKKILP